MKESFCRLLDKFQSDLNAQFIFADGSVYRYGGDTPKFSLHFRTDRAIMETVRRVSLGFGESYMAEEIEVEGDLQDVAHFAFQLIRFGMNMTFFEKVKTAFFMSRRKNTLEGSRKNISQHYDLGNDFYKLWLDAEMQYTCAYFNSLNDSLEDAQKNKLDLVCRKLRLQPGETVVEAGCGWGGLALHAARNYGVKIRSYNISKEQIQFARERAKSLGIGEDQIEYVLDDYRNIGKDGRRYQKFVSVGMFEHVGKENYTNFYNLIDRVLEPKGMALVHTIAKVVPTPTDPWIEKYIFPGSYMPALSEIVTPIENKQRAMHVVDVENLRYHYALTLDQWSDRFEQNVEKIRTQYGESFVRMFRLYLRSSAAGFRYGGILLYQVLVAKDNNDAAPLTRRHFILSEKMGAA